MRAELPTIAVLAGGLATRLGELTQATPKALIDICGRPFLSRQLELLAASGVRDVVMCVSHHADQIEDWLEKNQIASVRVRFSRDGEKQLGTGGALQSALPLLGSPFFVTYGDSYLRCDYRDIVRTFEALRGGHEPPLGMMTVYENRGAYDTSNIVFRDGRILRYDKNERSADMKHIDFGLGVLTREAFDAFANEEAFDLARVYQKLLAADRLAGYEVHERFYEVGSHAGIEEFRNFIAATSPKAH